MLHRPLLLPRRRDGSAACQLDRAELCSFDIVRDGGEANARARAAAASLRAGRTRRTNVRSKAAAGKRRFEFAIDADWPSGAYRLTLTARRPRRRADPLPPLFIVSPQPGTKAGPHPAGGRDRHLARLQHLGRLQPLSGHHRPGPRPVCDARSSTQRPWCRGFVVLPPDAPRVPLEVAMPPKTVPRYPHMEWACATGHSKKYASSGWASYDSHVLPLGRARTAMPSISPASTICISRPKSSTAMTASSSSAMTNTGPGRCATRSTPMSSAAAMRRALPAISCGRPGWRTRAGGRSATNTAPAPRTRPISAATSPAPPIPGRRRRSAGRAR